MTNARGLHLFLFFILCYVRTRLVNESTLVELFCSSNIYLCMITLLVLLCLAPGNIIMYSDLIISFKLGYASAQLLDTIFRTIRYSILVRNGAMFLNMPVLSIRYIVAIN